nr:glutathione S-transferase [Pharsalia antennata]
MAPKLYMTIASPPVRAVLMCARAIDLELEFIEVDFSNGDHLKPEYVKINPLHTVPTLDDDGLIVSDSHAIMGYLIGKYAKDKSLYPTDVVKRALIDQRLYFDAGILFARHLRVALAVLLGGQKVIPKENSSAVEEAYGFLETFLKDSKYVAGDSLSIADFSIINTITNARELVPLDDTKYPNIAAWRKTLEPLPYYEINTEGSTLFRAFVQNALST